MVDGLDSFEVHEVVRQARCIATGVLASTDRLSDLGLVGLDLLACVTAVEVRFGIEFPADLVPALETIDDLVYYTATKLSHQ